MFGRVAKFFIPVREPELVDHITLRRVKEGATKGGFYFEHYADHEFVDWLIGEIRCARRNKANNIQRIS